jgi:aminoglycoside phosphotransferase (APT) family kinase protein
MEHARAAGYPVPAARAINETDIVMERLTGPTMLNDLGRRPWRIGRHASTLAELHRCLHAIEAPGWLPAPLGDGVSLLHLDLHPDNVILTARGPYVIDWPNAARGPALGDVAHTWLVLEHSVPTGGAYRRASSKLGRALFLRAFLAHFDRGRVDAHRRDAAEYRLNRVLPQSELDAIVRVAGVNPPRPAPP